MNTILTSPLDIAQKVLSDEAIALTNAASRLDQNFEKIVHQILCSKGKLVIIGIGKSAHIANKVVATLNSTGTPSQFLHAAEAIHGDLGLICPEDILLVISNSGTSPEIVNLIPFLKKGNQPLIAMTGNPSSALGKNADFILNSGVDKEACPNNLAPTSSTTVQMALGDALAVCLMKYKNFGSQDFAACHPGGALGKNLWDTVDKYVASIRPEIHPNADLQSVIISLSASRHGVSVVMEDNEIKGIITDGDLRRFLQKNTEWHGVKAKHLMSNNPKSIDKSTLASQALQIFRTYNIGQLVVTDNEKYYGIIALHTLLDAGIV